MDELDNEAVKEEATKALKAAGFTRSPATSDDVTSTVREYLQQAEVHADNNRFDSAIELLDRAQQVQPLPFYSSVRADLLERGRRTKEALEWYSRAVRADPTDAEAWYGKARCLINLYALVSTKPVSSAAYPEAIEAAENAAALGNSQAAAVADVLRPFSALFAR